MDRLRVYAMARPRRPAGEAALVRAAALEAGLTGSARSRAAALALLAARLALADIRSAAHGDDFAAAIERAQARLASPALFDLATCPEIDLARVIKTEAIALFESHGCTAPAGIDAKAIAAAVPRLAERFRRALR